MKYSFAELGQNILTRKFGGTNIGTAEPYISGYFFVWFDYLPATLINYTGDFNSGIDEPSDIQNILAASCTGCTPPGGTLNKVEYTGLGGVKWAVPGHIDYQNSVSLKFIEFYRTPILDIMHGWVKMIRDYRTGTTDLESNEDGSGYTKRDYAGTLYYWTTTPDAKNVEYFACYDGIFPAKDPQDLYHGDVETVGRLDVEIEFNVDYIWHEPWVKEKCKNLVSVFQKAKQIVQNYQEP
jgi:hypothetical protein